MPWQWSSLSPSDESRFVPHSSVADASSITEHHLTANKQAENADSERVHGKEEVGGSETISVSNTDRSPIKEPSLEADDESGIEGATIICFTPGPSQSSSPTNLHLEGAAGDVHVASSFDGRSTTEYELLDCIHSKESIDVEEDNECIGVAVASKKKKVKNAENHTQLSDDMAAILANSSLSSTLPSLSISDEDTIPTLPNLTVNVPQHETPQESDETKTPQAVPKRDLPQAYSEDTTKDKERKEDNSAPDASPKVDFKNFWEGKLTFTDMTKSVIGWILRQETPEGVDLDAAPSGSNNSRVNFIPENPFCKHMMKLFLDEESTDVVFDLSSDDHSPKVQYHAHRLVLKANAPGLARLCEGSDKSTPVSIPDVEPQVFLQLLQYVYGGDISPNWENDAKNLIDAADKYEVIGLKVEAEAWYVTYSKFTVGSVIEDLLYADTMNCPLLREATMDFILKNAEEVVKSDSFKNDLITKAITNEILLAIVTADRGRDSNNNDDESMSINDLRMALYEKGLDIDGSRELLIFRLKK